MSWRMRVGVLFALALTAGMGVPAAAQPTGQVPPSPVTVDRLGTAPLPPTSGAPAPPQTDASTDSHVYVDAHAGTPRAMAMVHFDFTSVPPGAPVTSLLLRMNDDPGQPPDVQNVNADSAIIAACLLTEKFTDGVAAAYDCDAGGKPVIGERGANGLWLFRLDPLLPMLLKSGHGIALVPGTAPGATFSVALLRKAALATADVVPAASGVLPLAPAGPAFAAPTAGVLPAAPPLAGPGVEVPAKQTPPATDTAPPAPVAALSAPVALARPDGAPTHIARWTLIVLPVAVGFLAAAADRRTLARVLYRLAASAEKGTTA